MNAWDFAHDLRTFGPEAALSISSRENPATVPSRSDARAYCARLALRDEDCGYPVSWLAPLRLRPALTSILAWRMWTAELAHFPGDVARRQHLLAWWSTEFQAAETAPPRHPVMIALRATWERFPFVRDALSRELAGWRDEAALARREEWDELKSHAQALGPSEALWGLLAGLTAPEAQIAVESWHWSGYLTRLVIDIPTAWDRGQIQLPRDLLRRHQYDEVEFAARRMQQGLRKVLRDFDQRAATARAAASTLCETGPWWFRTLFSLRFQIQEDLWAQLRATDYDVWTSSPAVSARERNARLLTTAWKSCRWPFARRKSAAKEPPDFAAERGTD